MVAAAGFLRRLVGIYIFLCLILLPREKASFAKEISILVLPLQVDVFSFGISMWEILTGEEPYANMHFGAIIGKFILWYLSLVLISNGSAACVMMEGQHNHFHRK